MEFKFTKNVIEDVTAYVLKNFPYSSVALIGAENLLPYLEKQGNKVYAQKEKVQENVRLIIVAYNDDLIDYYKNYDIPLIVITKGAPIGVFSKYAVIDFHIVEKRYPKFVFFDTEDEERTLQKEISAVAISLLTECYLIVGSNLRNDYVKEAYSFIEPLKESMLKFNTNREQILLITGVFERLGIAEFTSLIDALSRMRAMGDVCSVRFYSAFLLLYLIRWFTNIDFCVILPYMDVVRLRIMCETLGIEQDLAPLTREISYDFDLVKNMLPTKEELTYLLSRFKTELAVSEGQDYDAILTDWTLVAELSKKPNLLTTIVRAGYVDALKHERGCYETER